MAKRKTAVTPLLMPLELLLSCTKPSIFLIISQHWDSAGGSNSSSRKTRTGLFHLFQVAGGLASGQSVMDCAYKESAEEASVPEHILKKLKPCGTVR